MIREDTLYDICIGPLPSCLQNVWFSDDNLIKDSLCVMNCFPLFQDSLFVFWKSDYNALQFGSFWVHLSEVIDLLGCLYLCLSSNLGSSPYLFLSSSLSEIPTMHIWTHRSLRLCSCFFSLLSFCSLASIIFLSLNN